MHCSRRRLCRRGLEFYVCTTNKSALMKKKSGNLSNDPRIMSCYFIQITFSNFNSKIFFGMRYHIIKKNGKLYVTYYLYINKYNLWISYFFLFFIHIHKWKSKKPILGFKLVTPSCLSYLSLLPNICRVHWHCLWETEYIAQIYTGT